jgi:hypothetical protein
MRINKPYLADAYAGFIVGIFASTWKTEQVESVEGRGFAYVFYMFFMFFKGMVKNALVYSLVMNL